MIAGHLRLALGAGLAIVIAGLVAGLLFTRAALADRTADRDRWRTAAAELEEDYRDAAEKARADNLAAARAAEQRQGEITNEVSGDYRRRMDELRGAYERLRADQAAADPDRGGGGDLPGVPGTAAGADAATGQNLVPADLPAGDALTATGQAIQLDELIRWIGRQQTISSERSDR